MYHYYSILNSQFLLLAAPAAPTLDEALDRAVDGIGTLDLRQVPGVADQLEACDWQLVAHALEHRNRRNEIELAADNQRCCLDVGQEAPATPGKQRSSQDTLQYEQRRVHAR